MKYRTWEIFGGGKFWRTMQVKAIGEEKFGEKATVSAYATYVFRCICEYWRGIFWRMAHDSPNSPIFPLPKFSHVQYWVTSKILSSTCGSETPAS